MKRSSDLAPIPSSTTIARSFVSNPMSNGGFQPDVISTFFGRLGPLLRFCFVCFVVAGLSLCLGIASTYTTSVQYWRHFFFVVVVASSSSSFIYEILPLGVPAPDDSKTQTSGFVCMEDQEREVWDFLLDDRRRRRRKVTNEPRNHSCVDGSGK